MHRVQKITLIAASALAVTCVSLTASSQEASQETEQASAAASRGVMQDRSYSSAAEALYVEKCSMCHREMGMGTVLLARRIDPAQAELEDRSNLTAQFVEIVVRQGLGNMPAIPPGEVSDAQLEMIADYLTSGSER